MQAVQAIGLSEADYLAGELLADVRHEYLDGQVRAMAGESKTHNTLVQSCLVALLGQLRGRPCATYTENVKTRVHSLNRYYYPDVVVTCDGRDTAPGSPEYFVDFAALVVEVLSPTTAAIDRGEKLAAYKLVPSLQAYLLVSQDERRVELYRRGEGKLWFYQDFGPGELLELPSLGLQLAVDDIYAGTRVGEVAARLV